MATTNINREEYENFLFQILSEQKVDEVHFGILLSQEGFEQISAMLKQFGFWDEFKTFQSQQVKTQQETAFQTTMLDDQIRALQKDIEERKATLLPLHQKLVPLRVEFRRRKDRLQLYPENPRFQQEAAQFLEKIQPIEAIIDQTEADIQRLEGELTNLQAAKIAVW